ncbi:MAG: hypothetical protein IKA64_02635 [Clostridia bacterium]|nr:hypothetical protein [Clostridia bacterium]
MSDSFLRFKKRILFLTLLRSGLISLSLAFFTLAVLLVLDKRRVVGLGVIPSVLISLGVFAIAFSLLFLILRPTDKRAASMLDRELSLGARVRTMLEFSGCEGGMYELQREDAERHLAAIPEKRIGLKRSWAFITALAVSLALFGSSFAVPALAEPPEGEIVDDYERDWRVASLLALIERIETDNYATPDMKTELVAVVNALITVVESTDKDAVMRSGAVAAVLTVDDIRESYVTSLKYAELLRATERSDFAPLADALDEFDDIEFSESLEDITDALGNPLANSVNSFLDVFMTVVDGVGASAETDPLTGAIRAFTVALRAIADGDGGRDELDGAVYELSTALFDALVSQHDDNRLVLIVRSEIITIFGLTAEDLAEGGVEDPEGSGSLTPEPDNKDDDEITPGAGYGKGDQLAGSNDTLYDHESRDLVTLPEVVGKYYSKFDELMDGMDEELRAAMEKYFEILQRPSAN